MAGAWKREQKWPKHEYHYGNFEQDSRRFVLDAPEYESEELQLYRRARL
jgi:hypothetical protein